MTTQNKNMTLETKLNAMLPQGKFFTVKAFELWPNGEGSYSVNDAWYIVRNVDREEALQALRNRWEIFKANYLPKARVSDLTDTGYQESEVCLEVDCTAFCNVTIEA